MENKGAIIERPVAAKGIRVDFEGPVLVQCNGFRCLAVHDDAGQWRGFFRGYNLPEPVVVLGDEGLLV